jgi:hypothetical protein
VHVPVSLAADAGDQGMGSGRPGRQLGTKQGADRIGTCRYGILEVLWKAVMIRSDLYVFFGSQMPDYLRDWPKELEGALVLVEAADGWIPPFLQIIEKGAQDAYVYERYAFEHDHGDVKDKNTCVAVLDGTSYIVPDNRFGRNECTVEDNRKRWATVLSHFAKFTSVAMPLNMIHGVDAETLANSSEGFLLELRRHIDIWREL